MGGSAGATRVIGKGHELLTVQVAHAGPYIPWIVTELTEEG